MACCYNIHRIYYTYPYMCGLLSLQKEISPLRCWAHRHFLSFAFSLSVRWPLSLNAQGCVCFECVSFLDYCVAYTCTKRCQSVVSTCQSENQQEHSATSAFFRFCLFETKSNQKCEIDTFDTFLKGIFARHLLQEMPRR